MKLILSVLLAIAAVDLTAKEVTKEFIQEQCKVNTYADCDVVIAIIKRESMFRPKAFNPERSGSYGLMQIQCSTAKGVLGFKKEDSCKRLFDPKENIKYGIKYLKRLENFIKDPSVEDVLSGYNAGLNYVCKGKRCRYEPYKCKNLKQEKGIVSCYPGEYVNVDYVWNVSRIYAYLRRTHETKKLHAPGDGPRVTRIKETEPVLR